MSGGVLVRYSMYTVRELNEDQCVKFNGIHYMCYSLKLSFAPYKGYLDRYPSEGNTTVTKFGERTRPLSTLPNT